jgi:hypothetical protein
MSQILSSSAAHLARCSQHRCRNVIRLLLDLSYRDFNLDEKIEALPSLSLEEFQLKKKARKKRNPSNSCSKKSVVGSVPVAAVASTRLRAASLDSQHTGESAAD